MFKLTLWLLGTALLVAFKVEHDERRRHESDNRAVNRANVK